MLTLAQIKSTLKKLFVVYPKAYSNNLTWPITLHDRQPEFDEVAVKVAQLRASGWVLDIGTGPGHLPVKICGNCPDLKVLAIDIEPELIRDAIKRAKKKRVSEKVSFICAQAESLPFGDDCFETVVSMFSFHLWKDKEQGLKEILRVLKPGGTMLILVGRDYLLSGFSLLSDYFTNKSLIGIKKSLLDIGFKQAQTNGRFKVRILASK